MHDALCLAITSGLSFAPSDFGEIAKTMRGTYWMGDAERYYRLAVEEGHTRACVSMEMAWGRKPFMWEGKRLYVGANFPWAGTVVTVTSFNGSTLVACSYKPRAHRRDYGANIEKRFTIDRDELVRAEADRKVEITVRAAAKQVQNALGACSLFADIDTIIRWTPEEREAASEWARFAKVDAHKERVRPPPPPPHVAAMVAEEDRIGLTEKIRERERNRSYHTEQRDYHAKALAELDALQAKLAETEVPAKSKRRKAAA
jgi:hypothetical protein